MMHLQYLKLKFLISRALDENTLGQQSSRVTVRLTNRPLDQSSVDR